MSEENIAIVRRAYEAFKERNVDAMAVLADPDCEFLPHQTASRARRGQPYRGHQGLRQYMEDVARIWQEMEPIPQEFRDLDDAVLVLGRIYARGDDGLLVDSPSAWLWKLREGKIVSGVTWGSHEEGLEAAGLTE